MDRKLWQEAKKLAHQHYDFTVETDSLSDGRVVYVLQHPDLPGCKAQGFSMDEANRI